MHSRSTVVYHVTLLEKVSPNVFFFLRVGRSSIRHYLHTHKHTPLICPKVFASLKGYFSSWGFVVTNLDACNPASVRSDGRRMSGYCPAPWGIPHPPSSFLPPLLSLLPTLPSPKFASPKCSALCCASRVLGWRSPIGCGQRPKGRSHLPRGANVERAPPLHPLADSLGVQLFARQGEVWVAKCWGAIGLTRKPLPATVVPIDALYNHMTSRHSTKDKKISID